MQNAGLIARQAAADALIAATLGIRETGHNRGEYIDEYNRTAGAELGSPYCCSFVYTRLKKAAKALGKTLPASLTWRAYTPDVRAWAITNQLWIPVATAKAAPVHSLQAGDLALFYFASLGRIGHVETVVAVHEWGVETVGANTGPDAGDAVERNGDGVYKKKRTWGQLGARGGYARLPF